MTAVATPSLSVATGDYAIDPSHSWIGFAVKHAGISLVRGSFPDFEGTGHLDGEHIANTNLQLEIRTASVTTNNGDRDAHLRSPDFLDVDAFPTIRFVSTAVSQLDATNLRLTGELTIKGTTRPVTVDFEYTGATTDPFGLDRVGLHGTTTVSRSDWGLVWNVVLDSGASLVGDKAVLTFEVSAIKQG